MSSSSEPKNGPSLRSNFLLSFFLILCLGLTSAAGYVKMRLDQAELELSAPEQTTSTEQNLYEKTISQLGFGGFLGIAQTYMTKLDRTDLGKMRQHYETARNAALKASEKAPASIRHDIEGILNVYSQIVVRAETGGDALSSGITQSDLMMASNAMSTLGTRLQTLQAQNKISAQDAFKKWSLALMLLSWAAVLLATSLTFWAFGAQDKQLRAPLKALAQSVSNMTKVDLGSSIWGLERNDEIGDLAREIDMARRYFAQIPDISIVEETGTTHLKFEGKAHSLFKNMMKEISHHFEKAEQSTNAFTGKISVHQENLIELNNKIKAILMEIEQKGEMRESTIKNLSRALEDAAHALASSQANGVQLLQGAAQKLVSSQELSAQKLDNIALSLVTTQERNAQQLDRIIPSMQERLQNMAGITQLAGSQITQSLTSLLKAEQTLRSTATQSQGTIKQLANATSQMGERMFAALNLMQASGKQFNETTESARSQMGKTIETLTRSENNLNNMIERTEQRLASTVNAEENLASLAARTESSASRMSEAVDSITERHEVLNDQVVTASHRMGAIVASFETAERAMNDATNHIARDTSLVSNLLQEMRKNNDQLLNSLSQSSKSGFSAIQTLAEKSHALMQRLEVQIQNQAKAADGHLGSLSSYSQSMAQQATTTNAALTQSVRSLNGEQEKLAETRSRFSETLNDLGSRLEQHATSTFGKTEEWASKSFVRLSGISEQVENVMQRLSMLGQLTGTLGTVAGQLGQIVPALTQMGGQKLPAMAMPESNFGNINPPIIIDMEDTQQLIIKQTRAILGAVEDQWHQASLQMEAMQEQLSQVVVQQKDQLETRLIVLDKRLRETSEAILENGNDDDAEEKQTEVINELISAISKINEHVMELDEVVEDAGLTKREAS